MAPKYQRLLWVMAGLACVGMAVALILTALEDSVVYFYSPSELATQPPDTTRPLRIGGLVAQGSVTHPAADVTRFTLTDGAAEITVRYQGILPDLFREGQGIVATGHLREGGTRVEATELLAKHDEYYMPREVAEALKESGHWQSQYGRETPADP